MKLSKFYLPLLKEDPQDASIISHKLMLRAGMIKQTSQGLYVFLPLGLMVLKKIENIIRKELNKIDCNELLMPTIQGADLWKESGRYNDYGAEMLKIKDRHGRELLYSPTNEEVMTYIFRNDITSYKQLPVNLYQIHWKFRDEIRPRFGLLRAREFLMLDSYSFNIDEASAIENYNQYYKAYLEIFKKMRLIAVPFKAATGAIGGNLSHEFQVIAETGESAVYYDKQFEDFIQNPDQYNIDVVQNLYAKADEEHDPENCPADIIAKRGIEVGHIFYFGTKYSQSMNASVVDKNGESFYPHMGSYGIGVSRLLSAIIESSHDKYGIIWNEEVAPFKICLLNLDIKDEKCLQFCDNLYQTIINSGIEVLYDDTSNSPGQKFSSADLIGIPYQIIIGKRGLENNTIEIKERKTGIKKTISSNNFDFINNLSNIFK